MSYPMVSLFSGAGGLDVGLEKAGFEARVHVEIDEICKRTLEMNTRHVGPNSGIKCFGDINAVAPSDLMRAAGLLPGETALLAGGPPCQAFSTAGNRGSIQDPRGALVYRYAEMVKAIQPRFFVFENVRGILSAAIKHRPIHERGSDYPPLEQEENLGSLLEQVIVPLFKKDLGYQLVFGLVNAADYGVPQDRKRVIFIGSRDWELEGYIGRTDLQSGILSLLPPTHDMNGANGLPQWRTLGHAIGSLDDPTPEYSPYSPGRAEVFALIPPGCNWRYLRDTYGDELTRKAMGGAYSSSGGRVGFWRRLSFDKVCPTLVTSPLQKATGLCHPYETRPLSVREYARIQQFDDDYAFAGSTADKYRQIGNAVPVGLAHYIGNVIAAMIETRAGVSAPSLDATAV